MADSGEAVGKRDHQRAGALAAAPTFDRTDSPVAMLFANEATVRYTVMAAAIMIALSPALFFSFGYANDFNAWAYDTHTCCTHHPETYGLFALGRYFGAFAENLQFWTIHSLADLWVWRLIGILTTVLLASYYLHIVSLRRPPTWPDALLTVAVFVLPTMQYQAVWVSMYMFWTPPILLSLVAAHLLLSATDRAILADGPATERAERLIALAFAALLIGCFFYPLSTTFVLVPATHLLLSEDKQKNRRNVRHMAILTVPVLGAAFVALFVLHKFIILPRLSNLPFLGSYAFSFADDPWLGALQRLRGYLTDGAMLWLGLQLPFVSEAVGIAAVFGAAWTLALIARRSIKISELVNVLMACCLFVAAAAPLLFILQFTRTYRVMFAMTAIELLMVFWLLRRLPFGSFLAGHFLRRARDGLRLCRRVWLVGVCSRGDRAYAKAIANASPREFQSIVVLRRRLQRTAFGLRLDKDFGGLGPKDCPYAFDLLLGTRYNGKAKFNLTNLAFFDDNPQVIGNDESCR